MSHAGDVSTAVDMRALVRGLACYREPDHARSVIELVITAVPLALLWFAMWLSLEVSYGLCLLLAVPAAGFLVRLFMIQHDCGHGAFFRHRGSNDWVGRVIGVLTLTPYDFGAARTPCIMQRQATSSGAAGDVDSDGAGISVAIRLGPVVVLAFTAPDLLFGIGPAFLFFVQQRLPIGLLRAGWRPWFSAMSTNVAIAIMVALMIWLIGVVPFLLVHLPIMLLGASVGVWLFYVQHQFEHTYWTHNEDWNLQDAALRGSSYYDLPGVLRWFSANIGVHHVHHLCSRIPFYRLPAALRHYPELAESGRLTLVQSFSCVRLVLWDEARRRLISFRELQPITAPARTFRSRPR
jgi:omega-6 fatty acid desaturase (delta-12 desaturase)